MPLKIKRKKCCCGAVKDYPCLCMLQGVGACSTKYPLCPCFKLLNKQARRMGLAKKKKG